MRGVVRTNPERVVHYPKLFQLCASQYHSELLIVKCERVELDAFEGEMSKSMTMFRKGDVEKFVSHSVEIFVGGWGSHMSRGVAEPQYPQPGIRC
jgi:hypothetical protein